MPIEKLLHETAVAAKQLVALSDEQVVKILSQCGGFTTNGSG